MLQYLKQQITSFTSSNITESNTEWSPSTSYAAEALVLRGTYVWKAVSANTDKKPEEHENVLWVKWQVSNKFAMLDLSAQSKSYVNGGDLVVEFTQNRMTTLAIGNYEASYVKVQILAVDAVTVLHEQQTNHSINENVTDYYSYIYEDYGYEVDKAIKIELPLWGSKVRVTFYKSTEATRSACGFLVGGTPVNMGKTLYGVDFSYNSYAVKAFDDFGTLSIVKRAVQDVVDFETTIESRELPTMRREIKSIYNDIVCFIVDENTDTYENLLTLGVIESASVVLSNPVNTIMTFSVIETV